MAYITQSGAPNKQTTGAVGDIYIDSDTGKQYTLVAIYATTTKDKTVTDYEWNTITTASTGDGSSYVSPTVTVTEIDGGHRVAITDINDTKIFDVMNGKSAYEIAQDNGFDGTEEEWYESLKCTGEASDEEITDEEMQLAISGTVTELNTITEEE